MKNRAKLWEAHLHVFFQSDYHPKERIKMRTIRDAIAIRLSNGEKNIAIVNLIISVEGAIENEAWCL